MRSRYSAFATKASDYLFNSTAIASQINNSQEVIKEWAEHTQWLRLTIEKADAITLTDYTPNTEASVQFTALYMYQKRLYQLTERSVFIVEDSQWKYLSGNILVDSQLTLPKRNEQCPCGSSKKFKSCCACR